MTAKTWAIAVARPEAVRPRDDKYGGGNRVGHTGLLFCAPTITGIHRYAELSDE